MLGFSIEKTLRAVLLKLIANLICILQFSSTHNKAINALLQQYRWSHINEEWGPGPFLGVNH